MDFQAKGPVTQERAEAATEWLIHSAPHIGEAKANRDRAEHMLKVVKSLAMKASGEKSAAAQEREALISDEYQAQVEAVFEASKQYEILFARQKAATNLIDMWRSINSALKGARV